jgi:7-cyano-7-deazaguanine synthase
MSNKKLFIKKALVVLSGGQDSTTALYLAMREFDEVHAITFDYGQRHIIEIEAARIIGKMAGVTSHEFVDIQGLLHSTSPLTSKTELEQYTSAEQMDEVIGDRVETTFVPMRNMLFFTIAANRAVELGCRYIFTGICQEDNANYPDCTEPFRALIERAINCSLAFTDDWIYLLAPLMSLSKGGTVKLAATMPGCFYALAYSHTSYDGCYPPTDMNHSNVLRAVGFREAGLPDPLVIRAFMDGVMDLPETPNYSSILVNEAVKNLVQAGVLIGGEPQL